MINFISAIITIIVIWVSAPFIIMFLEYRIDLFRKKLEEKRYIKSLKIKSEADKFINYLKGNLKDEIINTILDKILDEKTRHSIDEAPYCFKILTAFLTVL